MKTNLLTKLPASLAAMVIVAIVLGGNAAQADQASSDLSTNSWRMWPDSTAPWANDTLYLPSQVVLSNLPVNPPTGGWGALNNALGVSVTLPSSVEQYYWGTFGGGADYGDYHGVSWWWCEFTAPVLRPGQRLIIQFRAARLRAEVYCNHQLCGYSIINEAPFAADVTSAVAQGATTNQLAVRISSPGGELGYDDTTPITWGTNMISDSRGICGLDESIILEVRDAVCVSDFAVLNQPNPQEVWLVGAVTNAGTTDYDGPLGLGIQDSNAIPVWQSTNTVAVPAGGEASFTNVVVMTNATLWDITNPVLYTANASIPGNSASAMSANFGFRWFTPVGIGSNAMLQFNGRRVVLRSAISWGWWAPNGLFPTDAMARQEVLDAQALGLNCLQFHRNLGHQNVFDQQDQLGLLRYEEPGDGMADFGSDFSYAVIAPTNLSGTGGAPVTFLQQYEVEKILAMVRRDRSHPSLVVYDIQNEIGPCLTNEFVFWLFQQIHQIDPSRTVCLHSGIIPINQVLMLPYSTNFLCENGSGYSGWSDTHTVGGPGNYQDNLYINATDYSHYSANAAEVMVWGEMLGVGVPDDHDAIVTWYQTNGVVNAGYDLQVHQQALAAYNGFLDKWNFRPAFPTASSLFRDIGTKSYFFWQKLMENGRMCDNNDFLVISGWESTAINNHSGLVDQHRHFRADPAILKQSMNPEVLVIRSTRLVVKPGETASVDVHLINEMGRSGPQTLLITARNPDGGILYTNQSFVMVTGGNVFGEVLATNLTFVTTTNGTVLTDGTIQPDGGSGDVLTNEAQLLVIDPVQGNPLLSRVAVCEGSDQISSTLSNIFNINSLDSSNLSSPLDAIVMSCDTNSDLPVTGAQWQTALNQVYSNGVRLVLWPNGIGEAALFANYLAASNIVSVVNWNGNAGFLADGIASWLGSWYFCRQHWLLDGLPANSVLGWQYQVPALGTDVGALLLDSTPTCPMDVMMGYGRNHEACVGIAGAIMQYGKGLIVLPALPGLRDALSDINAEITQPVALRLLGNSLRVLPASLPSPPTDLQGTAGKGQVTLTWHPGLGGTAYNVKRSTISGGPYTVIAGNLTALSYLDAGLGNGITNYYVVSSVNPAGESSNSAEVMESVQTWPGVDIGAVGAAGSTTQSGDIITVNGSGADIYGTADAFQFASQLVTGDCDIRAWVTSVENTDPWAKAGVMIRETLNSSAMELAALVTPGNGATCQWRSTTGGGTSFVTSGSLQAPYWVRATRTGNTFTGYTSPDGTNWTPLGSAQTIAMNSNTYAGLAVTSHNDGILCTAIFADVSLVSSPSPLYLSLAATSSGAMLIQWTNTASAAQASLYYTPNLAPPVAWTPLTNSPVLTSNQWSVTLPTGTNAAGFYQLR